MDIRKINPKGFNQKTNWFQNDRRCREIEKKSHEIGTYENSTKCLRFFSFGLGVPGSGRGTLVHLRGIDESGVERRHISEIVWFRRVFENRTNVWCYDSIFLEYNLLQFLYVAIVFHFWLFFSREWINSCWIFIEFLLISL